MRFLIICLARFKYPGNVRDRQHSYSLQCPSPFSTLKYASTTFLSQIGYQNVAVSRLNHHAAELFVFSSTPIISLLLARRPPRVFTSTDIEPHPPIISKMRHIFGIRVYACQALLLIQSNSVLNHAVVEIPWDSRRVRLIGRVCPWSWWCHHFQQRRNYLSRVSVGIESSNDSRMID